MPNQVCCCYRTCRCRGCVDPRQVRQRQKPEGNRILTQRTQRRAEERGDWGTITAEYAEYAENSLCARTRNCREMKGFRQMVIESWRTATKSALPFRSEEHT